MSYSDPTGASFPGEDAYPLPPSPDPRRRVRRAAEGDARRPARALRRPGSASAAPTSSSWTRSSATTSSAPTATDVELGSGGRGGRCTRRASGRATGRGGYEGGGRGDLRAATSLLGARRRSVPDRTTRDGSPSSPTSAGPCTRPGDWDRAGAVLIEAVRLAQAVGDRRVDRRRLRRAHAPATVHGRDRRRTNRSSA